MTEISVYAQRRDRLQALMQRGIAVIPTAPEQRRNGDADYPYRFDSSFYYLSGFSEPEAVLVLVAGQADQPPQSILFCREKRGCGCCIFRINSTTPWITQLTRLVLPATMTG